MRTYVRSLVYGLSRAARRVATWNTRGPRVYVCDAATSRPDRD